ncbi:MAG TPA: hypothetical protein VK747_22300 [Blastocatellia bacterium]|nr:hypothetical protein [Blastocatellia bacterium]
MKKPEISFGSIPSSAVSETTLKICLKCAFDVITKQLKLTPRTAYSELKKHVPEESDFSGAATSRPHFLAGKDTDHCPFCNGTKRWFADFQARRIDSHPSFEKERKKLWTTLKKKPDRFTIWSLERSKMQIFSEWLERLNRSIDFEGDHWLLDVAISHIKRSSPSSDWDTTLAGGVRRVQLSREVEDGWRYENGWLYVSPGLYGDALMVQHLISRSHLHGGRTFEGRLTLRELMRRLRRIGYFEARGIDAGDPFEAFEQAIVKIVDSGPGAVYYAVDRKDYLEKLKSVYEKKRDK